MIIKRHRIFNEFYSHFNTSFSFKIFQILDSKIFSGSRTFFSNCFLFFFQWTWNSSWISPCWHDPLWPQTWHQNWPHPLGWYQWFHQRYQRCLDRKLRRYEANCKRSPDSSFQGSFHNFFTNFSQFLSKLI